MAAPLVTGTAENRMSQVKSSTRTRRRKAAAKPSRNGDKAATENALLDAGLDLLANVGQPSRNGLVTAGRAKTKLDSVLARIEDRHDLVMDRASAERIAGCGFY